jgi:hypothetical protein
MKGLYIGATRSFVSPYDNVVDNLAKTDGFVRAYLPVFDQLFKNKLTNEDQRNWNQLISLYMRILMAKSNAEAYVEYGWNDHSYNMRDFLMAPTHSAAYLAGFKKLVPLAKNKWLDLNAEINQMEQAPDYLVRGAGSWYVHGWDANYSNLGQVLGSGIGYGANIFTLRGTLRKEFKQMGLSFERLLHDPNEFSVRWTDVAIGLHSRYNFKSLWFSAECKAIRSGNYGWIQDKNKFNFTSTLSVNYGW